MILRTFLFIMGHKTQGFFQRSSTESNNKTVRREWHLLTKLKNLNLRIALKKTPICSLFIDFGICYKRENVYSRQDKKNRRMSVTSISRDDMNVGDCPSVLAGT